MLARDVMSLVIIDLPLEELIDLHVSSRDTEESREAQIIPLTVRQYGFTPYIILVLPLR
jgi:hypothetical protein